MGSRISFFGKKKQIVQKEITYAENRRDPLTTVAEVERSKEATDRINLAMTRMPPGTPMRWDKILRTVNSDLLPTEEERDPLRINFDERELKKYLRRIYDGMRIICYSVFQLS